MTHTTVRCQECRAAVHGIYRFPLVSICEYCLDENRFFTYDEDVRCADCGRIIKKSGYEVDGETYCASCAADRLDEGWMGGDE